MQCFMWQENYILGCCPEDGSLRNSVSKSVCRKNISIFIWKISTLFLFVIKLKIKPVSLVCIRHEGEEMWFYALYSAGTSCVSNVKPAPSTGLKMTKIVCMAVFLFVTSPICFDPVRLRPMTSQGKQCYQVLVCVCVYVCKTANAQTLTLTKKQKHLHEGSCALHTFYPSHICVFLCY